MPRIAIFPGSFDPFTNGHLDVVRRGVELFDEVIVAIGTNSSKQRYLPVEQMVGLIAGVFEHEPRVSVRTFKGLTAEFARETGARYLLRGLRNSPDFEYEKPIAYGNQHVNPGLETVFLLTSPALGSVSSTIIRDIHRFGGNVDAFLPYPMPPLGR
ncbi:MULTISPECIES: pantetheine-phosphate adenylyltransferase [Hymenobacter]|uniref:Phosphopantetheine adenylyltransferase n=1 Tax=Hymenobacter armeniacus TaxID=2771358 RepID=A0ABR8JPX4_9BACT|nr:MULTISPECIES: pantetheine-phosphate adenylyltransferase [Hymenobacter]MBD2720617.1 pantetheine-phosphate adenylyltransferase [Hymenobacter armeniacus]MBJ6111708.1 pantetheine-phosphate adenylyltransferase [Hymenobacter sp. BT523]